MLRHQSQVTYTPNLGFSKNPYFYLLWKALRNHQGEPMYHKTMDKVLPFPEEERCRNDDGLGDECCNERV